MREVPEGGICPILSRLIMTEHAKSVIVPEPAVQAGRASTRGLLFLAVIGGIGAFWALMQLDPLFRDAIAPWRTPAVLSVMRSVTTFGEGWVLGVLALGMAGIAYGLGRRDLARAGIVAILALIVSGVLSRVVKILVGRARPRAVADGLEHWGPSLASAFHSFPSGHATSAFTLAAVLAVVAPSWRGSFYAAAAVIAFSRVALDAHFLADVVAGGLLGWATGRLAMGIAQRRRLSHDGARAA
jgi:membrane-associated phospholipid phosphatase